MPSLSSCPACGYKLDSKMSGERIDRKGVLATYDYLPEKQVDVLHFLHRFTLASQQQIATTFFNAANPKDAKISCSKHLSSLERHGLIQRHAGGPRHNNKIFYSLTPGGMFCCEVEARGDTRTVKRLKEVKAHALLTSAHAKHHLYVVDVMSSFVRAERRGEGELTDYWGDREVSYVFPFLGSRRQLQPDSTFVWSTEKQAHLAWLELENRKGSSDQFVEKTIKYFYFANAGNQPGDVYKVALGIDRFPPLLVVTVRRTQLHSLRRGIIKGALQSKTGTLPDISRRIVIGLAALDDVRNDGVFAPVWEAPLQARGLLGLEELFGLRDQREEAHFRH
jgi:hypothetical protein